MKKILIGIICCILNITGYAQSSGNIYGGATGSGSTGTTSVDWVLGSISADGIPASIVLPVHFGTISAIVENNQLLVKWTTETETNNDHFDIEGSGDGKQFTKIATVASKAKEGNTSTLLQYEYQGSLPKMALALGFSLLCCTLIPKRKRIYLPVIVFIMAVATTGCTKKDALLKNTTNSRLFVRIAQVDKDGKTAYSKTVMAIQKQ